jgi:hypothetical protein
MLALEMPKGVADMDSSIWRMNFLLVCVGVALVMVLTKLSSLLAPYGWYFSFTEFLFTQSDKPYWPAVVVKFAIPIVGGIFVGFFETENPKGTAAAVGFASSFILAWPALNDWALYVTDEVVAKREYAFKIVYVLYFFAYSHLGMVGARLATLYLKFAEEHGQTKESIISDLLEWKGSIKPALIAIVSSGASFVLNKVFSE